jgi:hypothetical protein
MGAVGVCDRCLGEQVQIQSREIGVGKTAENIVSTRSDTGGEAMALGDGDSRGCEEDLGEKEGGNLHIE